MSKRDVHLFLVDIMDAITKIERYTAGLSFAEFEKNDMTIDAVTRNLEVIGEAAKKIPPDMKSKFGSIEWRRVTGFRDIAIHAYFNVDSEIIWNIATHSLSTMKNTIAEMLCTIESGEI